MSALDDVIDGSTPGRRAKSQYNGFVAPQITCADGFKVSVQASWGHYCKDALGRRPNLLADSARPQR